MYIHLGPLSHNLVKTIEENNNFNKIIYEKNIYSKSMYILLLLKI